MDEELYDNNLANDAIDDIISIVASTMIASLVVNRIYKVIPSKLVAWGVFMGVQTGSCSTIQDLINCGHAFEKMYKFRK